MTIDPDCIFCKIAGGEIPSKIFYQDDEVIAFHDIRPHAPVHFLIVPREHIPTLQDCGEHHQGLLGKMVALAPKLAAEQGITNGFRVVVNNGQDGGQEVFHLHVHVMGGPRPWKIG
ncbi:MAG: histidine triad nucleotide-binding protein [Burkholderiales bacterium]|nr:histidine triad nucleotide-binding protein [Burkholderiales bacterium]